MSTMLSTTSQYALRALTHLARQAGEPVLGRDLAQAVEIPANYLSKVLLTLRNAGLVSTTRGSGSGYRLDRPASEGLLIEVVELFEEISRTKPTCFFGSHQKVLGFNTLFGTHHVARSPGCLLEISCFYP